MNLRLALYDVARAYRLDRAGTQALFDASGLEGEPPLLQRWFWRGVAVLAAALGGLGLILWIAANWDDLGRTGRFGLLEAAVLAMCAGAAWRPAARAALGLVALLGTGALFAYFGQTYQTGADPWQLFALWAVLTLPLCLGVRSDVVWAPWALVAASAISLWAQAHTGHRWRVDGDTLGVHALAWLASALLALALSPAARRWTGAGAWSLRTAGTLSLGMLVMLALGALFERQVQPQFWLGLFLLAGTVALLLQPRAFEIYLLSAAALALDGLLVAGLVRLMFDDLHGDTIGKLFLIGLFAAGVVAASVSLILRGARRAGAMEAAP